MLLLVALLAQTVPAENASPENVVSVVPTNDGTYMLNLTTTEDVQAAAARLKAAADEACKDKGAPYTGLSVVSEERRSKKEKKAQKPVRHQLMQFITCGKPQPKPKP